MNFEDVERGVIVVAHPDDETMFAGGLTVRYPERWTIICCSVPRADPIRAWKFFDACAVLGTQARLLPFLEAPADQSLQQLESLELSAFDMIVTHNSAGEYGHQQHASLHRFIVQSWAAKVVTFGYRPGGVGQIALKLSPPEYSRKLEALRCYDHVSPTDGKPKWQALVDRYSPLFSFDVETYDRHGP